MGFSIDVNGRWTGVTSHAPNAGTAVLRFIRARGWSGWQDYRRDMRIRAHGSAPLVHITYRGAA
jgi:hypothetical protein